jgi:MFS family permease
LSRGDDPSRRAATRAALAIAPGVLLAGFGGGVAFPILPIVGARAGLPLAFIGLILAANRAARVVASPIVGVVADRFGARRLLILGLVIQVAVMLLYWLGVRTRHPGAFFLAGRLLHGPGSSCVFVSAQALALQAGGARHGGRVGGSVRAAMAIGVPIGLVVGGLLSELVGDQATFLVAAAALVVATGGAYALVPDLRVAVKRAAPLRDTLRGLLDRRLVALGSLNFAAMFAGSGVVLATAVLLVHARGITLLGLAERATAGACMGWLVVVAALSMPVFGRLGDRRRAHAIVAACGIALQVPALVVIGLAHATTTLALGLGLLGLGGGALGPSVLALVGEIALGGAGASGERRGLAVGVMQVCGDLGGAAGPLAGTALFAIDAGLPYFASAALVALFIAPAVWLARTRPALSQHAPHA